MYIPIFWCIWHNIVPGAKQPIWVFGFTIFVIGKSTLFVLKKFICNMEFICLSSCLFFNWNGFALKYIYEIQPPHCDISYIIWICLSSKVREKCHTNEITFHCEKSGNGFSLTHVKLTVCTFKDKFIHNMCVWLMSRNCATVITFGESLITFILRRTWNTWK